MTNNIMAIAVAPAGTNRLFFGATLALDLAMVLMVKGADAELTPARLTEDGIVQVGMPVALEMEVVTAHANATVPLYPFDVVTVMVEELPSVTPATTTRFALLLSAKIGPAVSDAVPELPA